MVEKVCAKTYYRRLSRTYGKIIVMKKIFKFLKIFIIKSYEMDRLTYEWFKY